MALEGYRKGQFRDSFTRELKSARKKAGKKIGGLIVRERRRRLGKASSRRKKAVRHVTGRKNGLLVVMDLAPLAYAREYGATIRPRSGSNLLVRTGYKPAPGEPVFTAPGGYVLAGSGDNTSLVGTLKSSVVIPRATEGRRLVPLAERYLDDYAAEIDKNLFGGS